MIQPFQVDSHKLLNFGESRGTLWRATCAPYVEHRIGFYDILIYLFVSTDSQ